MIDVDVWVRGQQDGTTRRIEGVPEDAAGWTDRDVKALLEQMLLALDRAKNPGAEAPAVSLAQGGLLWDGGRVGLDDDRCVEDGEHDWLWHSADWRLGVDGQGSECWTEWRCGRCDAVSWVGPDRDLFA